MDPISVSCPHCDVKLKIKDAALLGRTAKCPKCAKAFTVAAPAEPESDEYELEQPQAFPPTPAPLAPAKVATDSKPKPPTDEAKPSSKKSKTTSKRSPNKLSTNKPTLWVAGGAATLLLLLAGVGVVIWMRSGSGGDSPDESLAAKIGKPVLTEQQLNRLKERDVLKAESERLLKRGKLPQAAAFRQDTMRIEREVFGAIAPDVATSMEFIATCYWGQGDFKKAHATAQDLLELQLKLYGKRDWHVATTRYELAHYEVLQRLAPAQLQQTGDALRLFDKSKELHVRGSYAEALQAASQAAEINKRVLGKNDRSYAKALDQMGLVCAVQGDYQRAESLYRQALEIQKANFGEQHPSYALGLSHIASLYQLQADYARAESLYGQAMEIQKKTVGERHGHYATSLANLALMHVLQGDYARADTLMRQTVEVTKEAFGEQHIAYATCLGNLAGLYHSQGDSARAEPLCRQAAAVQRNVGGERHPQYAEILLTHASICLDREDAKQAEPLFLEAMEIQKQALGERHAVYASSLSGLASVYILQGQSARAEPLLRQAADIQRNALGERHPHYATSLGQLADMYASRGDSAQAITHYRQALEIQKKALGELHPAYATTLSKLGLLLGATTEGEKFTTEALTIAKTGLDRSAAIQSERQQLAMARKVRLIRNRYLSVARLGKTQPAKVYAELLPLKGLVSARQQELRRVQEQATQQPDSPAAKAFAQLIAQTRQLAVLSQLSPEPQQAAAHQQRMREAYEKLEELQQQLTKVSETYRQAKSQRARTPSELAGALPKRTALVDLVVYGQHLPPDAKHKQTSWQEQVVAFIVRPDQPVAWAFLGPAESMEKAVDAWRKSHGRGKGAAEAGTRLQQKLWKPLEPLLAGIDTVLISPDGPLCGLPWSALPGKSADKYMIEEHAFAVVPIPQLLPQLLAPEPKAVPPALLLVGDIDYGGEPGHLLAGATTRSAEGVERDGRRMTFARLQAGPQEIASIRNTFKTRFPESAAKAKTLGDKEATEAEFRKLSPNYRWLHVVTHGYFSHSLSSTTPASATPDGKGLSTEQPTGIEELAPDLLSGIALTGANQPPREDSDDGILTALEVSALDLHQTEMVVLSACETGLGRPAGGEGVLGLQRAFQLAGTRTVVASLWQVDDKATEILMQEFYEKLWKQKLPKLEALRQAQLAMLRAGVKGLQAQGGGQRGLDLESDESAPAEGRLAPYYWAAFVLSGDWR